MNTHPNPNRTPTSNPYGYLFPAFYVRSQVNQLITLLRHVCSRIEVVGSLRRDVKEVHDADIVIVPISPALLDDALCGLTHKLTSRYRLIRNDETIKQVRIITEGDMADLTVDLFIIGEQDFEAALFGYTGPKAQNETVAARCAKRGYRYELGRGIFDRTGQRVAGGTEESFYQFLGADVLPPNKRTGSLATAKPAKKASNGEAQLVVALG